MRIKTKEHKSMPILETQKEVMRHTTGTRAEWLATRLELLKAEKEHTRRSDELARRRQELPWVRVDKEYQFETDEGSASLADLFRGRSQLLVYHFMYGPDFEAGCPSCSAISFERRLWCEVRRAPSVRKRLWPAQGVSSPRPKSRSSRATWVGLRGRLTRRG